ncbi:hypothetical protein ATO12_20260 [Aquimarina atlantica]|uniref:3-keto-disaccharide hydrolase domain-containing protein n=1 Tax=Aquimarina atlantica TaxID=1317122 RepID=A0A023BTJ4_9FLAO|nr:hypothetical protein [Aquimarina atlantica]EZH73337.1 hypothetical protein ATO12_20260 [Aquimarina atlantica]
MKINSFFLTVILIFILIITACKPDNFVEEKISSQELSEWETIGKGKTLIKDHEFVFEEIDSSDGFFLVSPKSYRGDMVIQYKIKALSKASVLIVLFSASDTSETIQLTLPENNVTAEDIWEWRREMNHYNLTFNNESHGYTPFFYKNISSLERGFHLSKQENIMKPNEWVTVEIGRKENKVWFSLNDSIIFERVDYNPLLGGHILFRISGASTQEETILAKASIKDLMIYHQEK